MSISPNDGHGISPHTMAATQALDTPTRLKLARKIVDDTCHVTGAGYLLIMFVPGSDLVMRSHYGLDTPEECQACVNEVAGLLGAHAGTLAKKLSHEKANDLTHPTD